MSLYCLVYTSISNQKMSDDNLKELLKKSRLKVTTHPRPPFKNKLKKA